MKKEETYKCLKSDSHQTLCNVGDITDNPFAKLAPTYFAPYKFTTEDGIDYYEDGSSFYFIFTSGSGIGKGYSNSICENKYTTKRFSTHDKAQAYFYELNKPKFEVGKPYKNKNSNAICCYQGGVDVGYGIDCNNEWNEGVLMRNRESWIEASPAEWESALIKEAERRGYSTPGIKIKSILMEGEANATNDGDFTGEVKYAFTELSQLSYGYMCVFNGGKWASIIQEPEKEKTSDEYALEYYKANSHSLIHWLEENNLIITKAPTK